MSKNILLWAVLAVVWSSSFLAIKIGLETMGPLTLVAVRMVIGTTVMLIVLRSFRCHCRRICTPGVSCLSVD